MTEDVFRIVVTAGVVLASLAFVVQAGIMFAILRVTRKAQESAERFTGKAEPVIAAVGPILDRAGIVIAKAGPVIDRLGPVLAKVGPAIDKIGPALDEAKMTAAKAGAFVERATEIATTTNLVIEDARPHVAQIGHEVTEITRLGREQVERL